jgi:ribosomal protein L37E
MGDDFGWPRKDVACPRCGARVVYSQRKPYCPMCLWSAEAVRSQGRRQLRNGLIGCGLFALASLVFRLGLPMIAVGLIGMAAYGIGGLRLRTVPKGTAAPLSPQATIPERPTQQEAVLSKTAHWRWKLSVHPVLLAAMVAVFGTWLYLDTRALTVFSKSTVVFALLFGSVVCSELANTVALLCQYRLEGRIARKAAVTVGQVLEEEPRRDSANRIRYEFRDPMGRNERGTGDDLTGTLFEEMPVTVVFAPDHPSDNIPVTGLRFFTHEAQARDLR